MQVPTNDSGMDWNKILESLEEAKIPQDMTKEEFAAMSAAREARALLSAGDFDESDGWQEFTTLRNKQKTRRIMIIRLAIAASVALAIGAGLWLLQPAIQAPQIANQMPTGKVRLKTSDGRVIELNKETRSIQHNDIAQINAGGDSLVYMAGTTRSAQEKMDTLEIPRGTPFQLLLADGTRVWLNATSRLVFPAAFNGPRREVFLEGEGYFEVASKTDQPFIVHTGKTATTVLGTSFNVRNYDASVVTTLRTGKVQVTAGAQTLLLQPDEQSTFLAGDGSLQKKTVDPADYMAWVKGDLYFESVPLGRITESLSRYYDYTFEFKDAAIANLRFTLDMPRPGTLQEVLTQLSGTDLRFKVKGKTVMISRQP
ncbi:FecR family protein [Chitinophaga sp.]|uniref:FecR family protein n=1 Tax=Chitinophaga sp. TaxID=1869181 RepID=UPI002F9461C5